jgi:hypothetical protein
MGNFLSYTATMTFVEAAVLLLQEAGTELTVDELAARAAERGLLSKPGKDPLKSMKTRLTAELRKGIDSRVARTAPNVWMIHVPKQPTPREPISDPDPDPDPESVSESDSESDSESVSESDSESVSESESETESVPEPLIPIAPTTDEERALVEVYADDLAPAQAGAAYQEYRDELTQDEDRPMRPEILPKRDRFGRQRSDRRDRERGGRRKKRGSDRGGDRGERAGGNNGASSSDQAAPGGIPAADFVTGALQVLAARDQRKPITARQLADAMQSRGLIPGAPQKPGRAIKAALLHDAASRRARGLRPQLQYLGGDQFVLASARLAREVNIAEEAFEAAVRKLEAATRAALADRLARLSLAELERVAGIYLASVGWRDVRWIKRVDKSSYAEATAPGEDDTWLIGVRAGPGPVDRRGVGELRAGVDAKQLEAGLLLAPTDLSGEARDELDKDGAVVQCACGGAFVNTLAALGVGVSAVAAPVLYLDPVFFSEIADT